MDQPQHQVFGTGRQSYRFMSYPLTKQPLQLLYPGRLMLPEYHFSGDNIPNEYPIGLENTREENAAFYAASRMENEALARHLGGKDKVVNHPAVEPEAIIEDPKLTSLTLRDTGGLNPNLDVVPNKLDHLREIDRMNDKLVTHERQEILSRGQAPLTDHNPDNTLPRYDWEKIPEREYYNTDISAPPALENYSEGPVMITNEELKGASYFDCTKKMCTAYFCDKEKKECNFRICDGNGENCSDFMQTEYYPTCEMPVASSDNNGNGNNGNGNNGNGNNGNKTVMWVALAALAIVAVIAIFILIYGMRKNKMYSDSLRPKAYPYLSPQFFPNNMKAG